MASMRTPTIEIINSPSVSEQAVEIVERKGVGHPDYICDAAMEAASVALSREYIKTFGQVMHHNIDKGLLIAGQVKKGFGFGRVIKPMELIIGDRATFSVGRKSVPVVDIVAEAVAGWFAANLPMIDTGTDIRMRVALAPGSVELGDIFKRRGRVRGANDTSAAVGYAPFTPTEDVVYKTERYINSPAFKMVYPESGTDVKVMGVRNGHHLDITIACPLLSRLIDSEREYFHRKKAIMAAIKGFVAEFPFDNVKVNFNALDKKGLGEAGVYLAVLGTSAEDGDSGQVGRGNRVNGVISLARPMGTEAAAGKNPVSHVGKIYTVLAHRMAHEIYERIDGVKEVYVWLLSQIGTPIDRPKAIYVKVVPKPRAHDEAIRKGISVVVDEYLSGISAFTAELSRGEYPVC